MSFFEQYTALSNAKKSIKEIAFEMLGKAKKKATNFAKGVAKLFSKKATSVEIPSLKAKIEELENYISMKYPKFYFFDNKDIQSNTDLKRAYRYWLKVLDPDSGTHKNVFEFKRMQAERDAWRYGNSHLPKVVTKQTDAAAFDMYKEKYYPILGYYDIMQ